MENGIEGSNGNGRSQYLRNFPRYQQIYEYLLKEISAGNLKPGDQIPSEKELCDTFEVSRITSKKALEMLVENNLITRFRGKGSFVSGAPVRNGSDKYNSSFQSIAFLIPSFDDSFGKRLVYSVEAACEELGYHMLLKITRESPADETKALRALYDKNVAGILMLPAHGEHYNDELLRQILNKRPIVFIDRKMRGLPVPSVTTDCITASQIAVKWLFEQGHRNIAYYSWSMLHTSTLEDRRQGFTKAFIDSKFFLNPAYICDNLSLHDGLEVITRNLSEHPEINAAFAAEFEVALLVKQALTALGRKLPDDFSLVTYDNPGYHGQFTDFSCLMQDEQTLGKQAVGLLHRIIQGESSESINSILIPAKLVHGKLMHS